MGNVRLLRCRRRHLQRPPHREQHLAWVLEFISHGDRRDDLLASAVYRVRAQDERKTGSLFEHPMLAAGLRAKLAKNPDMSTLDWHIDQ